MAATDGGEPDAAAGSEPATAGQKDASGETTAAATAAAWDELPAAAADQTTVAATVAASAQTTSDESVAGGKTTAAATSAAADGITAAADSSSEGIRNVKLDKPTPPSDETTSAAIGQDPEPLGWPSPRAARDDAKKPWWTGMNWWEQEAEERKYWFHKWGLDELQEKQETTAMAYEETWYKAKAAEDTVAWYGERCHRLENEIDELHWCQEKTKKKTDKKFERMQKKLRQMEKMIEYKFVEERGKRRELELMVARVFEDLQHKVAWLMVQIRGWSSWKPWTTPSPPGLP